MSIPSRFRPGAKALILNQGKLLVVKERVPRNGEIQILYDFPGGGIELGESVVEGLYREVSEEVGLKVEMVKPVGSWDFVVIRPGEAAPVHIICLAFQCKVLGELVIDTTHNPAVEDIFETLWLTPDEINHMPMSQWSADVRPTIANIDLDVS